MGLFGKKKDADLKAVELKDSLDAVKREMEPTKETLEPDSPRMTPDLVSMNDGVNICAKACASCWDVKLPEGYRARAEYIGRRTKTGHTSIIEHSNVVFYVPVQVPEIPSLVEFLSIVRYANTVIKFSKKYDVLYMLIGGSWRAFSDIYLKADEEILKYNTVLTKITHLIYKYIPSDGMRDIIDLGILDETMFANWETNDITHAYNYCREAVIDDDIVITNMDSMWDLINTIEVVCPEPYLFTYKDLLPLQTVTIEFRNMSRIITQQLTRHRNGITQESQRYVNYSGASFNSPVKFRPDKYNPNDYYTITFGGKQYRMTLQKLGDEMTHIYGQLTDKMMNGGKELLKEDARGYLPNNTQCGKIFMTFTYYSLIKFLQLREDSHAQAEIRGYATRIGQWFRQNAGNDCVVFSNEGIYTALLPNSMHSPFTAPIINPDTDTSSIIVGDDNTVMELVDSYESSIEYADQHPEEATQAEEESRQKSEY